MKEDTCCTEMEEGRPIWSGGRMEWGTRHSLKKVENRCRNDRTFDCSLGEVTQQSKFYKGLQRFINVRNARFLEVPTIIVKKKK